MPHGNRIFQNAGETKAWSSLKISYTLQLLIRLDNTNLLSQATSVSIYCAEESVKVDPISLRSALCWAPHFNTICLVILKCNNAPVFNVNSPQANMEKEASEDNAATFTKDLDLIVAFMCILYYPIYLLV